VTLVLDSGGLTALAAGRALLAELADRGLWPAEVPTVTLIESLTGDHRRDVLVNRLLRLCIVCDLDESVAREAARLRAATGRAGDISAADAAVVAHASGRPDPVVITSDPGDITALVTHATAPVRVLAV